MSDEPTGPPLGRDPFGWESEPPDRQPSYLPVPRAAESRTTEVAVPADPDGPRSKSRNPGVAMLVVSVVLAILGLVGIGIGVGATFFSDDAPAPEVLVVSGPQVVTAQTEEPLIVQTPQSELPGAQPPQPSESAEPTVAAELPVPPEPTAPPQPVPLPPTADPDPVVAVARTVIPSVVLIEVSGDIEGDNTEDNPLGLPGELPQYGQGSGIIYDASGLILTNAHVLGDAETVRVQFADGTRAEGAVVGTAPGIDVGLVRVDTDMALTPAVFADRSTVEVGQLAVAIGSPFGLQQSVTSGIVSAVGRAIREGSSDSAFVEMIQTDAPINPGNSGGALANSLGQVIGMNTLIQTDGSTGNIGLGFAIPSDIALNIAQRILTGESTELGYLGVWGTDPEIGIPGALVVEVEPGTPAGDAGLMVGDLIVSMDNEAIATFTELAAKVQFRSPGTEVELDVVRDGANVTLTVIIGSRPPVEDLNE